MPSFSRRISSAGALLVILLAAVVIGVTRAAPQAQLVTNLPGIGAQNFSQYAGYITVNAQHGRALFYWFVESQNSPKTDPVLLWMNGGPGASSLMGFFTEHGPFRVNPDTVSLSTNPYSWNLLANIIYLEAPAGVGFSYSNTTSDYHTNDTLTALDNYNFLLEWFNQFPEYRSNPFYVTGESYAGHYCPELAALIRQNQVNDSYPVNMKGLLVGNPGTENDWFYNVDEYAFVTFMYNHGLIPEPYYIASVKECGWHDFLTDCTKNFTSPSVACQNATKNAIAYIPSNIDLYDVYAPVCQGFSKADWYGQGRGVSRALAQRVGTVPSSFPFYPCIDDYLVDYLNMPSVQQAIHARPTQWSLESKVIKYNPQNQFMNAYWADFAVNTSWRILIYSGDADSAVPFIGTQRWINCLHRPIVNDWRNWEVSQQTAGSVIDFSGISFLTVKGAGHMVPWYAPDLAYGFFSTWITGGDL